MNLTEMRLILSRDGIRLTKSLGQNFLHDANQLRRIAEAAELSAQDKVLEIGPGLGVLTELLLERSGEVLAIEKDARLFEKLRERFASALQIGMQGSGPRLRLIHDDALEFLRRERQDWSGWKLVANLPYSVASPILVELAGGRTVPERMVVTLQLEVARRLMALPGQKDYGLLTLLVQVSFEPRGTFKVPATCFFPEPDVDSACVCLTRRLRPVVTWDQLSAFTSIVKRAFSQRRKMMLKLLKQDWDEGALLRAFREDGLQPTIRAEQVDLDQFARLTQSLHPAGTTT